MVNLITSGFLVMGSIFLIVFSDLQSKHRNISFSLFSCLFALMVITLDWYCKDYDTP